MAELSRRSFVVMTTGGVLITGTDGAAALKPANDQCTLQSILARAPYAYDDNCVYLVEYPTQDGAWSPSARLLRGSSLLHSSITAMPDRWRLENGHRITMLNKDFKMAIQKTKANRRP